MVPDSVKLCPVSSTVGYVGETILSVLSPPLDGFHVEVTLKGLSRIYFDVPEASFA